MRSMFKSIAFGHEHPMLGRWCHRTSERYPKCDWMQKVDMANMDNNISATASKVLRRDPQDERADELRMMMVMGTFV